MTILNSLLVAASLTLAANAPVAADPGVRARCDRVCLADDPPPHPDNCPLCGGNPMVHVRKIFALADYGSIAAALSLGW